jgi:hypothetical protein
MTVTWHFTTLLLNCSHHYPHTAAKRSATNLVFRFNTTGALHLVIVQVEEARRLGRDDASREATRTLTPSIVIAGGRQAEDVEAGAESRGRERQIQVAEAGRQRNHESNYF